MAAFQTLQRSRWTCWLVDNPVLVREVRRRMRGRLFSWSLIGYVLALGVVSSLIIFAVYPKNFDQLPTREMIQKVGQIGGALYLGMCIIEAIIAIMIAPLLTAGVATQEKEKDTFDFLRVTTLSSSTFVIGCLLTSASFLLLIFTCTLPILALTFIFGGVSMNDILMFQAGLFMIGMLFSAWNVYYSTSFKRARGIWVTVVVTILLLLFFGRLALSFAFRGTFLSSFGVSGPSFAWWSLVLYGVVPVALITALFAVAASRRLYEPNNRLFNYKQFTVFYLLIMGGIAFIVTWKALGFVKKPLTPTEMAAHLAAYLFAGCLLMILAILLFSSGRIEKGDEVWQLRIRRPFFQRIDERHLLYLFLGFVWLIPSLLMGLAWDKDGHYLNRLWLSIYFLIIMVITVWGLVNLMSAAVQSRNGATLISALALLFIWGVVPALGVLVREISVRPGEPTSPGMMETSRILLDLSPFPLLFQIWSERGLSTSASIDILRPICLMSALALLLILPLFSRKVEQRLEVSYDWANIETRPKVDTEKPAEAA